MTKDQGAACRWKPVGRGLGLPLSYAAQTRRSSGFTLTEAVVTVAVIGALAAIAAPSWLAFSHAHSLNAAQDRVMQALRQAQNEAQRQQLSWQASFREVNGVVQVATHATTASPLTATWHNLEANVRIDPNETTFLQSGSVYRVQFTPKGNVNGQLGRFTVAIAGGGRVRRCVMVSTLLGALRKARNRSTPDATGRYCY